MVWFTVDCLDVQKPYEQHFEALSLAPSFPVKQKTFGRISDGFQKPSNITRNGKRIGQDRLWLMKRSDGWSGQFSMRLRLRRKDGWFCAKLDGWACAATKLSLHKPNHPLLSKFSYPHFCRVYRRSRTLNGVYPTDHAFR